jgi:hypothetical protein
MTGPLSITGTGTYLGDWGYNTLTLNDTGGYPGIFFRNSGNIWIVRRNGADNGFDFAYSTNATAQGTGTFTQISKYTSGGDFYVKGNIYVNGNGASTGTQVVYNSGSWSISVTGTAGNITAYTINQSVGTANSPTFAGLTINTGGTSTWGPFVVTSTSLWGDGATLYATIGAGGAAGIMIYNPHIVWNSGNSAAALRMGRSGGVSTGAYYEIGVGASDNFFIAKNSLGSGTQLNINSSGNATFSGTISASNFSGTSSGTNTGDQTNVSGTAGSTSYLSTLGSYVQSASTAATSLFLGITSSFVSSAQGWIDYGSLMTVMTYAGGGGTLQLYTPYSTVYGGSRLVYRSSDYNTGAWTSWKYLLNSSSDPYAYNMNQNVRTSDSPTFSGLTVNSNTTTGTAAGVINLGTTADPSDIANSSIVGLTWGLRGDSAAYYMVRSNRMTYGSYTYNRLDLSWHTGIVIGSSTLYGGIRFWNNSTNIGSGIASIGDGDNNMRSTADIIAYASDKRLKENIINIPNALDKIKQINGVYFDWKDKTKELGFFPSQKNDVGVIAQEIQAILPEVVTLAPFDYELGKSKSGENYLTVKYDKLAPLFIEAIKELNKKVEDQQKIINDLLNR